MLLSSALGWGTGIGLLSNRLADCMFSNFHYFFLHMQVNARGIEVRHQTPSIKLKGQARLVTRTIYAFTLGTW